MANLTGVDGPGELLVRRARPQEAADWDAFVERHPEGRFCHLWGYRRALESAYGYRCVYLTFFAGDKRVGVFPSIAVRQWSGRLISQPFNEYGGPLTETLSGTQREQLVQCLAQVAEEEHCRYVEIRGGIGSGALEGLGGCRRHVLYSYGVLALEDKEKLWRAALTNEARKGVNRARKAGLTAEVRHGSGAVADPFYEIYLASTKRLGVPPHSRRFFVELAAGLPDKLVGAWVFDQRDPAAILLGITTGQRLQIYVTVSEPRFWNARPNDLAHWELITWASAAGLRVFDFGSARYEGQIQFKKKWGVQLYDCSFYLIPSSRAGEASEFQTVDSSSKTMVAMAKLWRLTVPVSLARVLGPPIRKYLTK